MLFCLSFDARHSLTFEEVVIANHISRHGYWLFYSGLLWTSLHRNRPLRLLHSEASRSDELDPVHGSQHHRLPLLRLAHYLGADKVLRNIEDVTESE